MKLAYLLMKVAEYFVYFYFTATWQNSFISKEIMSVIYRNFGHKNF